VHITPRVLDLDGFLDEKLNVGLDLEHRTKCSKSLNMHVPT